MLAAAIALLGAGLAVPSPAGAARSRDYGDAPDGRSAGYVTNPGAQGGFPSRARSRGPSHPRRGRGLVAGFKSSVERASVQVDRDKRDDGASLDPRTLRDCSRKTTMRVLVNARGISPRRFRSRSKTRVYINAWFDWNRDGDIFDGTDGCAPEWAVQNASIRLGRLGKNRAALVPIRFRAGRSVEEFWWRVTVTLGERAKDPAGRRTKSYRSGETEDFLWRRLRLRQALPAAPAAFAALTASRRARASGPEDFSPDVDASDRFSSKCLGATNMAHGRSEQFPIEFEPGFDNRVLLTGAAPFTRRSYPPIVPKFIMPKRGENKAHRVSLIFEAVRFVPPESFDATAPGTLVVTSKQRHFPRGAEGDLFRERAQISIVFRREFGNLISGGPLEALLECKVEILHDRQVDPVRGEQGERDGVPDPTPEPVPECSDGRDNDGDGERDFGFPSGGDPGCASDDDQSERGSRQCDDGGDNDGDNIIDFGADPGCESLTDDSEFDPPQCSDGRDNDGDGKTDFPSDGGCESPVDDSEAGEIPPMAQCGDGLDNDGDGKTDFPNDPGCESAADDNEADLRQCSDGVDNDGDGQTDFPADPGCESAADDSELDEVTFGAIDLMNVHPNAIDCRDRFPRDMEPTVCSAVSSGNSTFVGTEVFRAPADGEIFEMTVRQPQESEVPGGGQGPAVAQTLSIQVFETLPDGRFRGGRVRETGSITGAGRFTLPVDPPFPVARDELIGIRIDPVEVGPFYLVAGKANHATSIFGGLGADPLQVGEERRPNAIVDGDLPVRFSLEPAP